MNNQINFLLQQAINSFHQGNISQTKLLLNNVLKIQPKNFHALHIMAVTLGIENKHSEALNLLLRAVKINPSDSYVNFNLAKALSEIGNDLDSIKYHQAATRIAPKHSEAWLNFGKSLFQLNRYDEALANYDKAIQLKPDYAEAWSNKGVTLHDLRRYDEALANYDKAIQLKPDYAEALSNKGVTLHDLRRYDEALANYDKAIQLKPDYAEAWSNKGITLSELKQYEEAIAHYDKAIRFKPNNDWYLGDLLCAQMKICSWSDLTESLDIISKKLEMDEKVVSPFVLLSLTDDSMLHKKCSEIFAQDRYSFNPVLGSIPKYSKKHKIRIGYFSSDFRNHAVSILTAELFELHDKSKFEIIAFSFGIKDKSALHLRVSKAFNQFIDVNGMSDLDIAKLSRKMCIDIAVDLGGYTAGARTNIFSYRAAPIQVSYLGYLGTMGAEYIDYIFADNTIIPECLQKFYTEKITYLPSYQVNDRKRHISEKKFTRAELSLPEKGFIFCCFNNNNKILPATFDGWMRILKAVDGSSLFLYAENEWVEQNLKKEAIAKGVDDARLVFSKFIPTDDYLARYQVCDLFLDTFPYNAGTTASDALWAELPILTLMGQSFASRMAASILNAICLPELITSSQEEYESLAIELALNPKKFTDLKLRLVNNRLTTPLFDTPLFTKNIEAAYIKMYDHYQNDLKPENIFIA
jgi:protein O-GlcNAc transferase